MTTASWSTTANCNSDAAYQAWRDELITKLGLMVAGTNLAADETNITPGVGTRTINTEQGYAVYHLADSLHGTAPVYIRFGFGVASAVTQPRIQVTVGTSTNGSGVLGGTALSSIASINGSIAQTVATAFNSYLCCMPGFLGLSWKQGSGSSQGLFFINRTCDSAGAITATGSIAFWGVGSGSAVTKIQAYRYAATAVAYGSNTTLVSGHLGFNPQTPTNTLVSGNPQVFLGWTITPQVAPLFGVCGALDAEATTGATFSVALVGSTTRTYIALTTIDPFAASAPNAGIPKMCILWE